MTVEAKKSQLEITDINQVVGHAVIMSFIHHIRHPLQCTMVPAIGISCSGHFAAVLYDCESDILLHLHPVMWWDHSTYQFVETGVTLLWLLIHHSLFLTNHEINSTCKSNLSAIFASNLPNFQWLDEYDIHDLYLKMYPRVSDDFVVEK